MNIDADLKNADWTKRTPDTFAYLEAQTQKYDKNQPRDAKGRWAVTQQQARAALMDAAGIGKVGVEDHPVVIAAAMETAIVLREMRAKGYRMPEEVDIRAGTHQAFTGAVGNKTLFIKVPDNLPPEVSLDDAMAIAYGGNTPEGIQKFIGQRFRDLVIHEMGHVNRGESLHGDTQAAADEFKKEMDAIHALPVAARTVSDYADTNPDEFVAEAFTVLYNGGILPPETMKVYKGLHGARIR